MMKFKDLSKVLLFERSENISKCCVLFNVSTNLSKPFTKISNIIKDEDLHEYGKESTPHVTGLYGINPSDNISKKTQSVLQKYHRSNIKATIRECGLFENGEFDVLKFDILSQDLHDINGLLTQNLDYENDYDGYNPHMTIAYLKPGKGQQYVDMLQGKLNGFPLEFGPPIFSDEQQNKQEMILGYPDNEDADHPNTGEVNEDLGYGGGIGGGQPYMSGHMGVYNSPDTTVPRTPGQYARYNMTNNNTVVTSGYYDTIFDADIKKMMSILTQLGFKVAKPPKNDEYSIRGMKRADQTHTMTNQSAVSNPDDVMNDDSGINMRKDTILRYIRMEIGEEEFKQYAEEQEDIITYDEVYTGLNQQMRQMKYPDKDFATIEVIKTLITDPKYYSGLGKYNINEDKFRQIKGTNMKSDCNVNQTELGSIVRNMLAEKNKTGRQAFSMMQETNEEEYDSKIPLQFDKLMQLSQEIARNLEDADIEFRKVDFVDNQTKQEISAFGDKFIKLAQMFKEKYNEYEDREWPQL